MSLRGETRLLEHPIRTWRRLTDTSRQQLADKLFVTRWTIIQIERGHRKPSVDLTRRIREVTGITRENIRPDIYREEV